VASAPDTVLENVIHGRPGRARYRSQKQTPLWVHLFPAGVLLAGVLGVVAFDLIKGPASGDSRVASSDEDQKKKDEEEEKKINEQVRADQEKKRPTVTRKDPFSYQLKDTNPYLNLNFSDWGGFGLTMTRERDPENKEKFKKLTYSEKGSSNNTIVKVDGFDYYFGRYNRQNVWIHQGKGNSKQKLLPTPRRGGEFTMMFSEPQIEVNQHVELVPGSSGILDTCLVWYTVTNKSNTERTVGLRCMVDTYIGANDGVPFTIPGEKDFLTTFREFGEKQIPDYIEAVESPDTPANLGTVARMQLKDIHLPDTSLENPDRLFIGGFPGENARWDDFLETPKGIKEIKDSCVIVYWRYQKMSPNEVRSFAFTYGLSEMTLSNSEDQVVGEDRAHDTIMALRAPASVQPGKEFLLSAYVWNGDKGQQVTIDLPPGIDLADGESAVKSLEHGGMERQLLSWKVRATKAGSFPIEATTRKPSDKKDAKARRDVAVKENSIFG
jgi:hypothetical protein